MWGSGLKCVPKIRLLKRLQGHGRTGHGRTTWTDHKVIVSVSAAASIEIMLRCCPIGGNQINEG